jgi:hypothetical protein
MLFQVTDYFINYDELPIGCQQQLFSDFYENAVTGQRKAAS